MPTKHVVFPMAERATGGSAESGAVAIGGRVRWKAVLDVARWTGSGNLEVVLEASPTGAANTWVQVLTFGVLTQASGSTTVTKDSTTSPSEWATAITTRDVWMRARIAQQTAPAVTFQCTVSAPWLDHTYQPDKALLSPEILSATSSITRIIDEAEGDVVGLLTKSAKDVVTGVWMWDHQPDIVDYGNPAAYEALNDAPSVQVFDAGVDLPGFFDAIRLEIAAQAEHLFQREQLRRRDGDKEAQVTWRKMARLAPGLGERLQNYQPKSRNVWRGR